MTMVRPLLIVIVVVIMSAVLTIYLSRKKIRPVKRVYQFKDIDVVIDDAVIDKGDPYEIIDPVGASVNINDDYTAYEKSLEPFSTGQRYILSICWYLAEVNNGGHDQFYFNSTGVVWEDAINGFQAIGVPEFSEIIQKSAQRLGGTPSKECFERRKQLDQFAPDFSDLDTTLYETEGKINSAMMQYIKQNRHGFYFDGIIKKLQL